MHVSIGAVLYVVPMAAPDAGFGAKITLRMVLSANLTECFPVL